MSENEQIALSIISEANTVISKDEALRVKIILALAAKDKQIEELRVEVEYLKSNQQTFSNAVLEHKFRVVKKFMEYAATCHNALMLERLREMARQALSEIEKE